MSVAEEVPANVLPTGAIPPPPYFIHPSMLKKLDPEYVEFFSKELVKNSAILYTNLVPLDDLRRGGNVIPGQRPELTVGSKEDSTIPRKYTAVEDGDITIRVFTPAGEPPADGWPCLIWYHGGGWVLGNINSENPLCSRMCEWAQCKVISVIYRLAPEFPYPACIHDSYEALLHVLENPQRFGINNKKVAIGGASAGGNISAVLSHKLPNDPRFTGLPPIIGQVLCVPVCDNAASKDSYSSWDEFAESPQLPVDKMMWYRNHYLPKGGEDLVTPESSPINYPLESFKKNCRAYVGCAGCDLLCSEGELYAHKLKAAGIKTDLIVYPGVPHPVMAMDEVLTQGKKMVADIISFLKDIYA